MPELREGLQPLPRSMQQLEIEERGWPVPFFADRWPETGKPELRVMDPHKLVRCIKENLCWVCGGSLDSFVGRGPRVFVIGPMCSINRISAEPPSHPACARYSVQNCPFLSRPQMVRNHHELGPLERRSPVGMLEHNPGVTLLWWSQGYEMHVTGGTPLFHFTKSPLMVEWYCEGRRATREECEAGIQRGAPIIEELARKEGPQALAMLDRGKRQAAQLLPKAIR